MIIKKILSYLLILTVLVISYPLISFGQIPLDGKFLELTMVPENPEPYQPVKITLKSYTYDLNRVKITWLVDGVKKETDIGLTELNTVAGKGGKKTTVKAIVDIPMDEPGEKGIEAFFIPSLVDLIYESQSYTPPFYKGKALNPNQGTVLVTAIPELIRSTGVKIPTQNIIYAWKLNGQAQRSSSGYGKNTFSFSGTVPIRDTTIEVNASSVESDISATKTVKITNDPTQIIFYENNPVYGLMTNKAIEKTVKMTADEFSVVAVPYFFSTKNVVSPDLEYVWTMNGKLVSNQDPKNSFTTRVEKAGRGTAEIGLHITNLAKIMQFIDNSYTLNFEKR